MAAYIAGFSLGLSLILAIGSQNAFVLKQGLKRQHVFVICLICAVSDALLISLGVAGFGVVVERYPVIETLARYAGIAFLLVYASLSFRAALVNSTTLQPDGADQLSLRIVVLTCLAFTWLNPHVYLDTFFLVGSVSTQYRPDHWYFAGGAITASFVFFFLLGYGARVLTPMFRKPVAWRLLELLVGATMLIIAYSLIRP